MAVMKKISIIQKLVIIMVAVTAVAMFTTALGFVGYQVYVTKKTASTELSTLARVVGTNCSAALLFSDTKSSQETLRGLNTAPTVVMGCIYDGDGKVFACYEKDRNENGSSVSMSKASNLLNDVKENTEGAFEGVPFIDSYIDVFEDIIVDDEIVGWVWIKGDFSQFNKSLKDNLLMSFLLFLGACLLAFILAGKFQSVITRPIVDLSSAMEKVAHEKDFGLRLERTSEDELGLLFDGFNGMLEQIEQRDAQLESHRRNLQQEVNSRTSELSNANANLEHTVVMLAKARDEAEAASRAKSQFSGQYESRNPDPHERVFWE